MATAIVGANWGDEGKGKMTDLLARESDIVVRFWARSIANGQKTGIYLRFVDAKGKSLNGQKLGNDNITYVASGATAWREHIAVAKAPANATQLALWIHSVNNAFSKADIDDFSIAVITPEEAAEIKKTIAIQKLNAAKPAAFPVPTAERIAEIAAMLPEKPTGPCPKASDRMAWQPLMDTPAAESIIKRATAYIGVEPPPLTDEGYLEFSQNGNRSRFEAVYFQRTTRLNLLALAETLEYKGRFIPTLESDIHAICNEKSWNLPAHDKNLNDFYNRSHHAALFSGAVPVGEIHLLIAESTQAAAAGVHDPDAFDDVLHLAPVGTGIHEYGSAYASRDAARELKARKALPGQERACRRHEFRCSRAH